MLVGLGFVGAIAVERRAILFELADHQIAAVAADFARVVDRGGGQCGVASAHRQLARWIEPGRDRRAGRGFAAVVGIAEDEFARLDQMQRIAARCTLVCAANDRLRDAVDEAERLVVVARIVVLHRQLVSHRRALGGCRSDQLGLQRVARRAAAPEQDQRQVRLTRAAPPPLRGSILARIAQDARARRAGHALRERRRETRHRRIGQAQRAQAPRGHRKLDDRVDIVAQPSPVIVCDMPRHFGKECARGRFAGGQLPQREPRCGQEAHAAEHQALDFVGDHLAGWPRRRSEAAEPGHRVVLAHRADQPAPDRGVGADHVGVDLGIGAVPEPRRQHRLAGIAFEPIGIGGALGEQIGGAREADGVGPRRGEAKVCQRDEVFEIRLPTAAIVGEEDEIARARHGDPAREMDRADRAEIARPVRQRAHLRDRPERQPHRDPPHQPGFEPGDRDHVVLRAMVLARGHLGLQMRGGKTLAHPVERFEPA